MSDAWRPRQSRTDRIGRAVQSMVPGTMEGRIASASMSPKDLNSDGTPEDVIEAVFSYPGVPTAEESPPYVVHLAEGEIGTVFASTRSTTTGPTTVSVRVNGSQVATVTVPSGARKTGEVTLEGVAVDYGDQITVAATVVGGGMSGLVVQVLVSE